MTSEEKAFFSSKTSDLGERNIDLRLADGSRHSEPYTSRGPVQFFADEGSGEEITMVFHGSSYIKIIGHNLTPVYEGMLRHSLVWVRESDRKDDTPTETAIEGEVFIGRIFIYDLFDPVLEYMELERRRAERAASENKPK